MTDRDFQWHQLFMRFATDVGNMSTAIRLKLGAVAVKERRVIAIGYNGTPPGHDNSCEITDDFGNLVTKPNVIHAEDNLIRFAKERNIDLCGCTLYVTHSPCPNCCDLIRSAGFKEVIYGKPYRIMSGLTALRESRIMVTEWN